VTKPFYLIKVGEIWYAKIRDPHTNEIHTKRSTGQTNKTRAENWARLEHEKLVARAGRPDITLGEWADKFFVDGCPHGDRVRLEGRHYGDRTEANYLRTLRAIRPDPLFVRPISSLRRADLLAFRSRLVARFGIRRVAQSSYAVVRLIIREALFHEIIDRDPTAGIGQVSVPAKRRRALSLDEIRLLLNPDLYLDRLHYEATLCAATTGMRAGEVRALRWADLDGTRIKIRWNLPAESTELVPPKWGKVRVTAYPSILAQELEPRRGPDEGWVFSVRGGLMGYKRWLAAVQRAAKLAKIGAISLHGLRHSLLTLLRAQGIPDEHLKGSFGWSGPSMIENYTHRDLYDHQPQAKLVDTLIGGRDEED
jgi:integrase